MPSDTLERANRLRERAEVNRETARELCETAETTRGESAELVRRCRASRERVGIRGPAGSQ
jgi:hypothetical protein